MKDVGDKLLLNHLRRLAPEPALCTDSDTDDLVFARNALEPDAASNTSYLVVEAVPLSSAGRPLSTEKRLLPELAHDEFHVVPWSLAQAHHSKLRYISALARIPRNDGQEKKDWRYSREQLVQILLKQTAKFQAIIADSLTDNDEESEDATNTRPRELSQLVDLLGEPAVLAICSVLRGNAQSVAVANTLIPVLAGASDPDTASERARIIGQCAQSPSASIRYRAALGLKEMPGDAAKDALRRLRAVEANPTIRSMIGEEAN